VKRRLLTIALALALLTVALVYGTVFSNGGTQVSQAESINPDNLLEIISLVRSRFYKPVDVADLLRAYAAKGNIPGMLAEALNDPYTRYMDQKAYEEMLSDTSGVFGGIGIVIGIRNNRLTIVSPIKGTPGERAGLRAQDHIVMIDGRDTSYMTTDEAAGLMRGEPGTTVTITIERDDERFDVTIVREIINANSIDKVAMLQPGIGYIQITNFTNRTYDELVQALNELDAEGMQGLILDLRFNPGGTLAAALAVADEFIAEGPLVHLEDRYGNRATYSATAEGTRQPMPMVVLINGSSASASEIVSGALRDHGLATLIGTTTFGKGLVQSIIPLRDGGALSITEQVYLTAGGHDINQQGIAPDIEIPVSEEEELLIYYGEAEVDPQLEKAIAVIQSQIQAD